MTSYRPCRCLRIGRGGFTLVELLLVVTIIGLMVGIATPNIVESMRVYRMNTAVDAIDNLSRYARAMAVLKQTESDLYFDLEAGEVRLTLGKANEAGMSAETVFGQSGFLSGAMLPSEEVRADEIEEEEEPAGMRRLVSSDADQKTRKLGRGIVVDDFSIPEERVDGEAGFRIVYYPSGQCDGGTITLLDTRKPDDRLARILTIDPVSGEMTMERDE